MYVPTFPLDGKSAPEGALSISHLLRLVPGTASTVARTGRPGVCIVRILAVLRGGLHRGYGVLVVLILLLDLVRVALLVLALIVLVHVALIVVVRVRAVCYLGLRSLGVLRLGRSGFGWFGRFARVGALGHGGIDRLRREARRGGTSVVDRADERPHPDTAAEHEHEACSPYDRLTTEDGLHGSELHDPSLCAPALLVSEGNVLTLQSRYQTTCRSVCPGQRRLISCGPPLWDSPQTRNSPSSPTSESTSATPARPKSRSRCLPGASTTCRSISRPTRRTITPGEGCSRWWGSASDCSNMCDAKT